MWGKAAALYDPSGNIAGAIESIRDVTEQKRTEDELRKAADQLKLTEERLMQSSKMAAIGQLAAGVAHEVNNPLTGVLNNVQLIMLEINNNGNLSRSHLKEALSVIEESALRCKKITQALLDFSHISRGDLLPCNLNSVTDTILGIISQEMRLANIEIKTEFDPGLPYIQGDSQLLGQAILGLINNSKWAVENKNGAREISVRTRRDTDKGVVSIAVSDTGKGIPREIRGRLFEPFFTTKMVGEGTGLGLAMISNIVKKHRGDITVDSELNAGTTVTLNFPYKD